MPLVLRIDTPIEVDYYAHGGILPYVLRQLLAVLSGASRVTIKAAGGAASRRVSSGRCQTTGGSEVGRHAQRTPLVELGVHRLRAWRPTA